MIALCLQHHKQADVGTYTIEQLREFKAQGRAQASSIAGRFDWMRRDILAVVGGSYYYRIPAIVVINDVPAVWFTHNEAGELRLNFKMPSIDSRQRATILDNAWEIPPEGVETLICPPNGREISVKYSNGDYFRVVFSTVDTAEDLRAKHPDARWVDSLEYPLTMVELWETAAGTPISFTPKETHVALAASSGNFSSDQPFGMKIKITEEPAAIPGGPPIYRGSVSL
jgi:hypothetical protein